MAAVLAAVVGALGTMGPAHAALVDRGGGMVYDTTLGITWLADMNHAQTDGTSADGRMVWGDAMQWAANLSWGGHDDWRLPTLDAGDTTCSGSVPGGPGFGPQYYGFDCTGGELSHLFVVDLGNEGGTSVFDATADSATQTANLALFANVQSGRYWSGTTLASDPGLAIGFRTTDGFQGFGNKVALLAHAVAVRDGDVAAAVPEPPASALALAALGVLAALRGRRRA